MNELYGCNLAQTATRGHFIMGYSFFYLGKRERQTDKERLILLFSLIHFLITKDNLNMSLLIWTSCVEPHAGLLQRVQSVMINLLWVPQSLIYLEKEDREQSSCLQVAFGNPFPPRI